MNLATIRVGGTVACGPLITRSGFTATICRDGRCMTGPIVRKFKRARRATR